MVETNNFVSLGVICITWQSTRVSLQSGVKKKLLQSKTGPNIVE